MSIVPSKVVLPPDSTGKAIDNTNVTTSAGSVHRQVLVLADPENPLAYGAVGNATPAGNEYASLVRHVGVLNAQITGASGVAMLPAAAAAADTMPNMAATQVLAPGLMWNGSSWDRSRGNTNVAMGDTGVKTASFSGATQTNHSARGAKIFIAVSSLSGLLASVAIQLQFSPDGGTSWVNIGSSVSVNGAGTTMISIYPTSESVVGSVLTLLAMGVNNSMAFNAPLPRTWRLTYTLGGTTPSATISVSSVAYLT